MERPIPCPLPSRREAAYLAYLIFPVAALPFREPLARLLDTLGAGLRTLRLNDPFAIFAAGPRREGPERRIRLRRGGDRGGEVVGGRQLRLRGFRRARRGTGL